MLHAADKSPVKFERVCERDGRPVAWADLVKGYEYTKGQFVILTKEDFRAAAIEKTHRVDIVDFVTASGDRRSLFRNTLLRRAGQGRRSGLRAASRGHACRRSCRHRQGHPARRAASGRGRSDRRRAGADAAAVRGRAGGPGPVLAARHQRRFPKPNSRWRRPWSSNLAAEWNPEKYTDEYRDNLMRVIQAKAKGRKAKLESAGERQAGKGRRSDGAIETEPGPKTRPA